MGERLVRRRLECAQDPSANEVGVDGEVAATDGRDATALRRLLVGRVVGAFVRVVWSVGGDVDGPVRRDVEVANVEDTVRPGAAFGHAELLAVERGERSASWGPRCEER